MARAKGRGTKAKGEKRQWWHISQDSREVMVEYIRSNLWTLLTISIVVVMSVMIGRNVVHAISIGFEIAKLEREREEYQYLITRDSSLLESLNHDDELEKYARENFYMQGKDEEIYVIKRR